MKPANESGIVLGRASREWHRWLFFLAAIGLAGIDIAADSILASRSSVPSGLNLLPPFLYAFFAIVLLLSFYLARKEALIDALREQIKDQKIETEMNREIALLDPVTGIYNRRYARIMLQREVNRANRYGSVLAIMMVDVTGFRRVNESLGHTGGDVILRQIALLLQNKIRNSDIIIRFGGDEFLLVLPEAQEEGIEKLAERIRESIHEWAPTAGVAELNLNFAIGIAYYKSNSQIDKVILLAEQRMLEDRLAPQPQRK